MCNFNVEKLLLILILLILMQVNLENRQAFKVEQGQRSKIVDTSFKYLLGNPFHSDPFGLLAMILFFNLQLTNAIDLIHLTMTITFIIWIFRQKICKHFEQEKLRFKYWIGNLRDEDLVWESQLQPDRLYIWQHHHHDNKPITARESRELHQLFLEIDQQDLWPQIQKYIQINRPQDGPVKRFVKYLISFINESWLESDIQFFHNPHTFARRGLTHDELTELFRGLSRHDVRQILLSGFDIDEVKSDKQRILEEERKVMEVRKAIEEIVKLKIFDILPFQDCHYFLPWEQDYIPPHMRLAFVPNLYEENSSDEEENADREGEEEDRDEEYNSDSGSEFDSENGYDHSDTDVDGPYSF